MSEESKFSLEEVRTAAQQLVKSGQDVRSALHELTMKALTQRQLAEQEIREVLEAITEGVSIGASERAEEMRAALSDALQGVDDALGYAAEAMHLALDEVSSHTREFAENDVKPSLGELKKLQEVFLDTVWRSAQSATGLVRQEMAALLEHAGHTSAGAGGRVKNVAEDLSNRLRSTAHEAGDAGKRAAREIGLRVATLASRKLAEMAEKIDQKAQALKQDK